MGLQTTRDLIPAKQRFTNSCVSACIATAIAHLSRNRLLAIECRDRLESVLGDKPIPLPVAANIAIQLFPDYSFTPFERRTIEEAIDSAKTTHGIVILGLDAAMLYGEPGGPRRHAVVVVTTTDYPELQLIDPTKRFWIQSLSHDQALWDPDPTRDGHHAFSLAEAARPFAATSGQYLIVGVRGS